jgi:NAD(P)-dependent dehydrogenase (short-subunit alcohol dehydrogenase family)
MNKVVLITGASSGIGKETAKLFQSKNWKVAATMRDLSKSDDLQRIADIECFRLDVTDKGSIKSAVEDAIKKFGRLDAVVNNAGYWLFGTFEGASSEQILRQFDTNVFGMMNVCREVLPYFREQKKGTIINISSVGGRVGLPAASAYSATKFAVEGFSESIRYELKPLGIRVKLIEPGPIATDFYGRSEELASDGMTPEYDIFVKNVHGFMKKGAEKAPAGNIVAEAIYDAARDSSNKFRYPVNTKGLLKVRRLLPDTILFPLIKYVMTK